MEILNIILCSSLSHPCDCSCAGLNKDFFFLKLVFYRYPGDSLLPNDVLVVKCLIKNTFIAKYKEFACGVVGVLERKTKRGQQLF